MLIASELQSPPIDNSLELLLKTAKSLPLPYTGNKKKLLPQLHQAIKHLEFDSVLDAFSGSGIVSYYFKALGKKVTSNDLLTYSYNNSLAFAENNNTTLTNEEKNYLLFNKNPNKTNFVLENYCGEIDSPKKHRKFTRIECGFLDNFRANVNDLRSTCAKALSISAISTVVLRLPFGNLDRSKDFMKQRRKQVKEYGVNSDKKDRRIGIYYDNDLNLNFEKWFLKYSEDFEKSLIFGECRACNLDVMDILSDTVDCVYLDPPYGGVSSNYLHMYGFLDEYIDGKTNKEKAVRFVHQDKYEDNFYLMLQKAEHIPIWLISYNDRGWKGIEYMSEIVRKYRSNVEIKVLSDNYSYIAREKMGNKTKGVEYLILAQK